MKYNDEEIKLIKRLYLEDGLNTVNISKLLNRSQTGIERFLKREDIFCSPRRIELSKIDIETIIGRYMLGETAQEIYYDFSNKIKSPDSILHILRKNNINRRDAKRRSVVTYHNYFEDINTEDKAYFLGLLIADGSILNNRTGRTKSICLELKECDRYIIENFANKIGFSGKICKTKCGNSISFSSKQMANDLENFGVVNNKTCVGTYLPTLDESLMNHLIRGIFDGDGTVHVGKNNRFNWGFYGSDKICNQIQNYLSEKLSFKKNIVFNKGTVSFIYLHSKERTKKFYDYIYNNASIYLIRKRNKFDFYLANTEVTI